MRLRKKWWAIPEMMEDSRVVFNPEEYRGNWDEYFKNNNPIHLEIGPGKGDFVLEMARRNPSINYIIIERETNALGYAMRKIRETEVKNIAAIPYEAEMILNYIGEGEVEEIYINFCNPWPKNRQHKRRLTHLVFLKKYRQILKEDSKIFLKTDDLDFFKDSLEYFKRGGFETLDYTFNMKLEDYPDSIVTEYERKWRSKNIPICYGIFKLISI